MLHTQMQLWKNTIITPTWTLTAWPSLSTFLLAFQASPFYNSFIHLLIIWKSSEQKECKARGREREEEEKREWFMVLYGHSGQANARRFGLPLVAGRKLSIGEVLFCFFRHSIRKLDRKWSSWNSNQHSYMEDSVAISCLAHCAKARPRPTLVICRMNIRENYIQTL